MKLNLRSVDLNLLPVFAAIMEAGQLSRAAEQLGMSQPAISAALQRLRHTLGDDLFVRTRQGMEPTPRARELYEQLAPQLDGLRNTLDPHSRFDPATSQRHFRLISLDYFEMVLLPPLLTRIRRQAPEVIVEIVPPSDDMGTTLSKVQADLAIDAFIQEDDRLQREVLMNEQLVVVARQGHPQLQGKCSKRQFLDAEHVVLPATERHTLPLEQILGRPDWRRRVGAQVVHYSNLLSVASASDLIATVPLRLAQRLGGGLKLQVLPFPVAVPPIPIYLIWPRVLESDRAHGWFCEQLLACLPTDDR